MPVDGDVRSIAVADINEDGLVDIIFSVQRQSSGIRLLLNQSQRRWIFKKGPIEINKYEGIRSADINGDGHMDIIAANVTSATQGGIQIWLGDGMTTPGPIELRSRATWTPAPRPALVIAVTHAFYQTRPRRPSGIDEAPC